MELAILNLKYPFYHLRLAHIVMYYLVIFFLLLDNVSFSTTCLLKKSLGKEQKESENEKFKLSSATYSGVKELNHMKKTDNLSSFSFSWHQTMIVFFFFSCLRIFISPRLYYLFLWFKFITFRKIGRTCKSVVFSANALIRVFEWFSEFNSCAL